MIETMNNAYYGVTIMYISFLSILFAVCTISAKNPVVAVLNLIGLFVTISVYLLLLGLDFLALAYLLVYVGAVSILFIFILMLINVRTSELAIENQNSIVLAILSVISLNSGIYMLLPYATYLTDMINSYITHLSQYVYYKLLLTFNAELLGSSDPFTLTEETSNISSISWEGNLIGINHIASIGNNLYTNLSLLLLITSFILLVAMIGTIIVTGKKKPALASSSEALSVI